MSLDADEIKKIAMLARLQIDESDIPSYVTNLSNILDLVAQMEAVNTDGVIPMSHPQEEAGQRLREDIVSEENQREAFQAIAPATDDGLYLVPKVIE